MKAAGIGGVEINPIACPGGTDPVGYKALTIFILHSYVFYCIQHLMKHCSIEKNLKKVDYYFE